MIEHEDDGPIFHLIEDEPLALKQAAPEPQGDPSVAPIDDKDRAILRHLAMHPLGHLGDDIIRGAGLIDRLDAWTRLSALQARGMCARSGELWNITGRGQMQIRKP